MTLDAYMDDFGRDLKGAAAKRRSRRRAARLLLPAVPALAVAFAVIPRGGDVDAVAAARAALAPNGELVHLKIEMRDESRFAMPSVEQWYAADLDRWRARTTAPRLPDGRRGSGQEVAFANDRLRTYNQRRDVVTIWRPDEFPRTLRPSLLGGDPATELRDRLGEGDVRDEGVVEVEGRRVRRLVRESRRERFVERFAYYVDPETFAPVGGALSLERGGKTLPGPSFSVTLYERLPLDARSRRLLELEKTPGTKYVWR